MVCTRFEVFDHENVSHGGFMHKLHYLDMPGITSRTVSKFWNKNLQGTPIMEGVVKTYFTPDGLKRFKKNIESLKRLYSQYQFFCGPFNCIMDVKELTLDTNTVSDNQVLYQDEYQIVIRVA